MYPRYVRYRSLIGLARGRLRRLKKFIINTGFGEEHTVTWRLEDNTGHVELLINQSTGAHVESGEAFFLTATGSLPVGFDKGKIYYLVSKKGDNYYKFSETKGGQPLTSTASSPTSPKIQLPYR